MCRSIIAILSVLISVSMADAQSLQEQAICAAQAKKTFQEDSMSWDRDNAKLHPSMRSETISFDFQSHYNTMLKHCLIYTERTTQVLGKLAISKSLYNAFERRDYGVYFANGDALKPFACQLLPLRGEMKYCTSEEEFQSFVREYMGQ